MNNELICVFWEEPEGGEWEVSKYNYMHIIQTAVIYTNRKTP